LQLQVGNSPFNAKQSALLNELLESLTPTQKIWLSGFFACSATETKTRPVAQNRSKEVTILYGSQTGNSQGLAKKAGKALEEKGYQVHIEAMNDFKANQLKKVRNLLIIISTHGEGDPPDNAVLFHEYLHGKRAPKLDGLSYSVLALGDSSYEYFCQVGKEFDKRLEELGGVRLYPRFDCDVDFEEPASEWLEGVIHSLEEQEGMAEEVQHSLPLQEQAVSSYSRSHPYQAEVLENINLNGRGSAKETRHLELSLAGSGLTYQPGDSLGIFPKNDPALVAELIEELKWSPEESVPIQKQGDRVSLREALTSYYEITVLTKPLLQKVVELTQNEALATLLSNEKDWKAYLKGRDLLDLVRDVGCWGDTAEEFVSILRKIPPRLYSIASSVKAYPDEVHLTVGTVRYTDHERERKGVCSCYLAERLELGEKVSVFVQENDNFRLPKDPQVPIIMIGPGTGVAPYRAFLQEREELGYDGKAWLFFGDQHFMTDFLYQTEWNQWLRNGILTRLTVAFSRDQEEKVYVQHRMLEESKEIFSWLEEGAVVYICGDEKKMAKDVHQALIEIIAQEGAYSREEAEAYLADMQKQRRYQRDVY